MSSIAGRDTISLYFFVFIAPIPEKERMVVWREFIALPESIFTVLKFFSPKMHEYLHLLQMIWLTDSKKKLEA